MPSRPANTETIENYLKAIHTLASESPTGEAGMKAIATLTGVTVGTASTMVQRIAAAKLAKYERFGGVRLTAKGERAAIDVVRRHRLIETFLVQTLKLDWSVVHIEAERLEHALSPVVLEALDTFLGHPASDPHGDPIPDSRGKFRETALVPLATIAKGEKVCIARVLDQSEASLRFLHASGLSVGSAVTSNGAEPGAGVMTVTNAARQRVSLGLFAAERVLVRSAQDRG
jgi:DtxR family transcriptional regulator, Mn-dependent transcriptional regulator